MTFFRPDARLTVWLRLADWLDPQRVLGWLQDVAAGGFGRKASTGSGQFDIDPAGLVAADAELPDAPQANAFMTLSAYAPAAADPTDGYWRYLVKRGKLGERFATEPAPKAVAPNVWKFPLIMFQPGSVFRLPPGQPLAVAYGRMVHDVHPQRHEVVQNGYAFPMGVQLAPEEEQG